MEDSSQRETDDTASMDESEIALDQLHQAILNLENTIAGRVATPPSTPFGDEDDLESCDTAIPNSSSVPWPGSVFRIRCIATNKVLTLLEGQIKLTTPSSDNRGSIHWACVENKGWLGFRNLVTGKFLGHDKKGRGNRLCCFAEKQQDWEYFCARMRPDGEGYVLLMPHYNELWPIGWKEDEAGNAKVLAKMETGVGGDEAVVWEFVEV